MATVNSTLSLTDRMSKVFNNITKASSETESVFSRIKNKLTKTDSSMKKTSSSAGSLFSSMLKANLVSSAISKLSNLIMGQLSNAVSRFDTLNNYTKVMHNLGISEEAANASRERLAQGLKGLPTTLDSAALSVQRFTAANKNVEASTEMYLALNNALLAGGASQELQASAMEQWAQAYSKGKPDAMEWKSLLQAMPGQLDQIAKKMNKTTNELGEDLKKGKVSMNDFMKAAVELNKEGIGSYESFEKQAKNATDGIGTSIANLKSSIARGWVKMFEGANKALEASGLPKINEIIANLGDTIENTMERIGTEGIPALAQSIQNITEQFGFWSQAMALTADTAATSTESTLTLLDYLILGFDALSLGVQFAIYAIQIAILAIWIVIQSFATGLVAVFFGLQTAGETIMNGLLQIVQSVANAIIDVINSLIDAFNNAFAAFGANVSRVEKMTLADRNTEQLNRAKANRSQTLTDMGQGINDTADQMKSLSKLTANSLYKGATNIQNKAAGGSATSKKVSAGGGTSAANIDWSNLNNAIGDSGSGKGSGGKAVKTTNTDKNLLSDDDIQLLLDVATRDYKLNYQQVTPNITLTFGDVRETADVDEVLDKVADRLEEIYDGNLEVA